MVDLFTKVPNIGKLFKYFLKNIIPHQGKYWKYIE